MQPSNTSPKVTMFYDGGCPLCSREVEHYKRLDKHNNVIWADIDLDPTLLKPIGVSRETAMRRLHVMDRNGTVVTGAYAFRTLWQELPYYRVLARIVSPAIIMRIADKAYKRFADYRYNKRSRCLDHCT